MNWEFPLPQASANAASYDTLFFALLGLTGAVALGLLATGIVFCIRYRRGAQRHREPAPASSRPLEVAWIAIPLALFIATFAWGARLYAQLYAPAPDALTVYVIGKQWMWKAQHENGRREIGELHLPVGQPVRLILGTEDVIHSFFVPAFRVKQDAVPGRYTGLAFTPTRVGEFDLRCAEYCGTDHSHMGGRVIVMPPEAYAAWLARGATPGALAQRGFELFRSFGCSGCHTPGSRIRAPLLAGLYGRPVQLRDGRRVVADEAYLRDSILLPSRDITAGFEDDMPSFQGQLAEEDLIALVAWIKSVKEP